MVISNTNTNSIYNCNGTTRNFNLGFVFDENVSNVSISVKHADGTTEQIEDNYEIVEGVLTYPTVESELDPLPEGDKIIIERFTPLTQTINLTQQGPLDAETLEGGYDKNTLISQELQEQINRAIKFPVADDGETDAQEYINDLQDLVTEATTQAGIATTKAGEAATSASAADTAKTTAQKWAEGTDEQVEELGGTHSAKEWANIAETAATSENVQIVVSNISNINTVAGISSDVTQVSGISNAVQNVANNESNVTLVADNLANVNTVASNMNSVLATAADIANVNIVAGDKTNIDTVAGISSDVSTVAGIYQDVSTVAEVSTDVSTVASNVSDVSTVATNISNVNSAVSNMAAIIAAPTAATNAANSATNAQKWAEGLDSDVTPLGGTHSAKGWANRAEQIVASLGPVMKYKGTVATYNDLPSTGQEIGDTYNILDTGENYAWDGTSWDALSSTVDLSAYRTSAAQDVIDAGKADKTNKVNGIPISTANAYYYAESTSAADEVEKTVSIPAITELNAGQVIIVKPTITSTVASSTLKLNSFTAYPMLYAGATITTSTDSKVWSANTPSIFVFDGSYWRFAGHGVDDNTTYTLNYLIVAGTANAGVGNYAVTRYGLLMQKLDGTWETLKETSTNYNTGTTKTVNTNGFIPGKILYYNSTTVKKNGEALTASTLYLKASTVDARYSFNCGATPGWSAGDSIYVVGTIGTDGLFYLDSTTWWSNALPTTKDSKVYMYIGTYLSDAYKISLDLDHPIYYHDGTSVKQYVVAGNKADLDSSTGKLLSTQVPDLSGTYVDLATTDQQITAQKIIRNNWIANAIYILTGQNAWSWYRALAYAYSRIIIGNSSNVGLQLETNESHIKAKIGANTYDVLTTADQLSADGVKDQRDNTTLIKTWTGTKAQYDAILSKDADTLYNVTDEVDMQAPFRNIGEIVPSTIPLVDAGLHLLDGSLLSGSGSYAEFVTHMAGVYADHSELFVSEADWQTSVTNYGVCDKFVYDSIDNTVRIPKFGNQLISKIASTASVVGTGKTLGLISSNSGTVYSGGAFMSDSGDWNKLSLAGNFTNQTLPFVASPSGTKPTDNAAVGVDTDPTKTNIVANLLDSAINDSEIYYYIVIANSTKTEIEVDIDEIATDLNGKADVDLSNVSNTSGFRKLTEVYNNGASWYKVYDEYDPSTGTFIGKWCEQGGKLIGINETDVAFLQEYADTNYSINIQQISLGSTSASYFGAMKSYAITTTGFHYKSGQSENPDVSWKAEGYIS